MSDPNGDRGIWDELRARHATSVAGAYGASFPIGCGAGWAGLVDRFFARAGAVLSGSGERLLIRDVKEKMGGLRISHEPVADRFADAIGLAHDQAEMRSFATCECCGAFGRLRVDAGGWWATRCAGHAPPGLDAVEGGPILGGRQLTDGRRVRISMDRESGHLLVSTADDETGLPRHEAGTVHANAHGVIPIDLTTMRDALADLLLRGLHGPTESGSGRSVDEAADRTKPAEEDEG